MRRRGPDPAYIGRSLRAQNEPVFGNSPEIVAKVHVLLQLKSVEEQIWREPGPECHTAIVTASNFCSGRPVPNSAFVRSNFGDAGLAAQIQRAKEWCRSLEGIANGPVFVAET